MILNNYEPQEVLKHFEAISQIPRGSYNEQAVSDYIADFATNLGYKTIQDAKNNLIIYKPATPGYENSPPIMLQAHVDMVCEKNAGTAHDFTTDPIKLYVDGDYIKAQGTTLGSDNGIGVAMCMALLASQTATHPPLEIVLTTEEEVGMGGAQALDFNLLTAKRMINLDNSDEKEFILGCVSGTVMDFMLPADFDTVTPDNIAYSITVNGLTGGHSGADIHLERGNALRILGNILAQLQDIRIAAISGGMKVNAIPREASATIVLPKKGAGKAIAILEGCRTYLKAQYRATDGGLAVAWEADSVGKALTKNSSQCLVAALTLIPCGVQHMSMEIAGFVNASCNLGVAETLHKGVKLSIMARAVTDFYGANMEAQINNLAKLVGARVTVRQRTPAWPYNPDSELLKTAKSCYRPVFGREAGLKAIHAGLECGVFLENIPGVDIIAIGPDQHDLHTPDERLSISSLNRMWTFLQKLLEVA